jgi:NAD(P)-dependent dehydrogenase (short-subunit alcohol dehydrogenase family)
MSAGTAATRRALELTLDEWDHVLNVNLRAPFVWSQAAGRQMARSGGGRIIHLASVTGQVGAAQLTAYCASKGGLIAMTRSLAVEWARHGILVNALAPGYVHTTLNADVLADPRVLEHITRRTPLRRLGEPSEVAAAALFLASDEASFITGHVLAVDGGWLAS